MKKFVWVLLLLPALAIAQPYEPMLDSISNTWYFTFNVIPVRVAQAPLCSYPMYSNYPAWTITTTGDTTINGHLFKALLHEEYANPGYDCTVGYLREDTSARQILFVDNLMSPEKVLYDFSMVPGDTIQLTFVTQGYFTDGPYVLDSISTINLISGPHRIFFLHNSLSPFSMPLQWIEGVGHPGNLIYTYSQNGYGGLSAGFCGQNYLTRDFIDQLTCFDHGITKVYFDSCFQAWATQGSGWASAYIDSCVYWNIAGGLEELSPVTSIKAAPNPANNSTTLEFTAIAPVEGVIIVTDLTGRKVSGISSVYLQPGSNSLPLNTSSLESGIYLIAFRNAKRSAYTHLVVNR
ncbi:MAG TPA: T9SS type A sorting domain-containing protein [Bacteroidia bacterium]|nr:T9SS type A sorting domain-containing protein [Bacteroidia bacterium]